jgi:hypothetical protein
MTIDLPAPMTLAAGGAGSAAGDGWTCRGGVTHVACRHAPLDPGTSTTAELRVDVGSVAGFQPVRLAISAAGTTERQSFPVVVAPRDTRTAYAATGSQRIVSAGNTLIRGTKSALPILDRQQCDVNDDCHVSAYHGDGGAGTDGGIGVPGLPGVPGVPGVGGARSRARLDLPAGARVRYAQLTWAGRGSTGSLPGSVRLTSPGGAARTVAGSAAAIDGGRQYSADVTSLVAGGGGGLWTFDTDSLYLGSADGGVFDGWGLLVVVDAPGAASSNVAVFDGVVDVGTDVPARLAVGTGGPAQVGTVLWDGDRGGRFGGDTLRIGGTTVADVGRSFCPAAPETAADPNWNTLGTDVATRTVSVPGTGQMSLSAGGDGMFLGGLAIAGPE